MTPPPPVCRRVLRIANQTDFLLNFIFFKSYFPASLSFVLLQAEKSGPNPTVLACFIEARIQS